MQYVKYIFSVILVVIAPFISLYEAEAISQSIVISQVQTAGAGTGTAGQEFVEVYNNSSSDVDVTGWCLTYSSSSTSTQSTLHCFTPSDSTIKLWIKARSYVTFVSADYSAATGTSADGLFLYNGGMAATGGRVRLLNDANVEIDKVAWGGVSGESTIPIPASGKVLQRKGAETLQDTDSSGDFFASLPLIHFGGMYELVIDVCPNVSGAQVSIPQGMVIDNAGNCIVPPPVDVCPNIAELQTELPGGYLKDNAGNCQPDSCLNLYGLQVGIPFGYDSDGSGECIEHDECPNLIYAQYEIPEGMIKNQSGNCVLDLVPLELTEIFPNAKGSDIGREFIEIYNPSTETVTLDSYVIHTGVNAEKTVPFPSGAVMLPGERKVFSDSSMGFTLVNTTGRVVLASIDGTTYGDSGVYTSPGDEMAWAQIDGVWQYTSQPTPGEVNAASLIAETTSDESSTSQGVVACAPGKYRNPLTNRCRNIESDATVLASCDADQYRSPDTGRCRKIASAATLTACKDG